MKIRPSVAAIALLAVLPVSVTGRRPDDREGPEGCTSVLVTKAASADGSVMTTHSCDGNYDFRLRMASGRKNKPGTMMPVYRGGGLGREREQAVQVSEIPESESTHARFDASYPFMNEKQLAMGETTIGGRQELENDEGLWDIMALERLALERTATARDAIRLMGDTAYAQGYYGSGECLTVIDKNEAWMFEVFGAGPTGAGAVWAARRIPDGEVGVSANRSRITTLNLEDKDHCMASPNVFALAEEMGWWNPKAGGEFVFHKAYSEPPRYYNTRREWRALSILAPSLKLDPWNRDVPFSVKPDRKVTVQDLIRIHRDSYEGTEFDLTQGLAAGPFGTPNRWSTPTPAGALGWERSIAIFRCAYCVILQSRDWLPDPIGGLAWFGEDDPKTSCFIPLYCGITRVPRAFEVGGRDRFERESAFWAFNFVANWAELKYGYMIEDIRKLYTTLEEGFFNLQPVIEKRASELYKEKPELAQDYLTQYSCNAAQHTVDEWWQLSDYLIAKYSDGYINVPRTGRSVGYPKEWLDAVGYGKSKPQP